MAIMKVIRVLVWAASDGIATTFTVKLAKDGDPYWVGSNQPTGIGGRIANWFADVPTAATPKGVLVVEGAVSAVLAVPTSVLTITVPLKPKDAIHQITLDLLFS